MVLFMAGVAEDGSCAGIDSEETSESGRRTSDAGRGRGDGEGEAGMTVGVDGVGRRSEGGKSEGSRLPSIFEFSCAKKVTS